MSAQPGSLSPPFRPRRPTRPRRLLEVALFVAVWMAIGELAGAGLNAYLLIGVPLTAAFQLGLRRRPIKELWVRRGPGIERPWPWRGLALALAIYPAYELLEALRAPPPGGAALALYLGCALAGAGAAAYAFTHFRRATWRWLGFCLATAGVIGALPALLDWELSSVAFRTLARPDADLPFGALAFLLYLPAMFVIEEVSFRAALGSHACHPDEGRVVPSAIYLATLWGIWHAPILGWEVIWELIAFHAVVGTFLSVSWHNSGNLGVSASAHAAYDAVRTALA